MKSACILGYGGAVSIHLQKELETSGYQITAASRSHISNNPSSTTHLKTDLLNAQEVNRAVQTSDIAFLTVGLPYNYSTWKEQWPIIMENVINACVEHTVKLVFFDNVYPYQFPPQGFTESTPQEPPSKKGQVRKQLRNMIFEAIKNRNLQAIIATSADFYGPHASSVSMLYIQNIEYLLANKKPFYLGNPQKLHSFTYVPDAAKAMVMLAEATDTWNEVWHLPTAAAISGTEIMHLITKEFAWAKGFQAVPKWQLSLIGIFNPTVRELGEMFYQYENDYVFHSDKFLRRFQFTPTSYEHGIHQTVEFFRNQPHDKPQ